MILVPLLHHWNVSIVLSNSRFNDSFPLPLTLWINCSFKIHCNLVIMLIMGAKRNERYNEMSVITK